MLIGIAYIDPSATTALVTGLAAVAVAIGAFVVVFVRKAKKKVSDKLGIEEKQTKQADKEVKFKD